jgi:hypothetical protein
MKTEHCNCASVTSITSFQIGPDPETDVVCVETLLMKLALAETVMHSLANYADQVVANGGEEAEYLEAPDTWAISGMFQNIGEVSHALKAGCFGYQAAHMY